MAGSDEGEREDGADIANSEGARTQRSSREKAPQTTYPCSGGSNSSDTREPEYTTSE